MAAPVSPDDAAPAAADGWRGGPMTTEVLFKREAGSGMTSQMGHPPICTVSFFDGDAAAVLPHLRARMRLLIDANPWLAGRLQKVAGKMSLVFPVDGAAVPVDALVDVLMAPVAGLSTSTPYDALVELSVPLGMGKDGKALVKSGNPVTKLVIAPLAPGAIGAGVPDPVPAPAAGVTSAGASGGAGAASSAAAPAPATAASTAPDGPGFAILFYMSHVVADGYTYYEILNQLGDGTGGAHTSEGADAAPAAPPVRAMRAARKLDYEVTQERRLMGEADFKYGSSAAFIKAMVSGIGRKPLGRPIAYYVDPAKVAKAKAEATAEGEVPFVSTNDVVTSHFLRSANVRLAMMTINYRGGGRWDELADGLDAGNYEGVVLSDPGGHSTPAAVRRSLTARADGEYSGITMPRPGFCCGGTVPVAFISSWASLGGSTPPFDLKAGGAVRQRLHLPILNMLPFSKSPMDVAIVFRALPTQLAVLYIAKRAGPAQLLSTDTILGECLDTSMFPAAGER